MLKGLYSPIDQVLRYGGGESATLEQNFAGDAKSYDPAASGDYVPSIPQRYPLTGTWSLASETGLQEGEVAEFVVSATRLPDGEPRADQATLTIHFETGDVTYRVVRVGRRVHAGRLDGYSLFLAA